MAVPWEIKDFQFERVLKYWFPCSSHDPYSQPRFVTSLSSSAPGGQSCNTAGGLTMGKHFYAMKIKVFKRRYLGYFTNNFKKCVCTVGGDASQL